MSTNQGMSTKEVGALFGLLVCGALLFLYKLPMVSATYDEGSLYLKTGQYIGTNHNWDIEDATFHPPLTYYLHGFITPHISDSDEKKLFGARLAMFPWFILCGLVLFFIAKRHVGANAAILALFLYVFNPEILSHARLITMDFMLAFMILVTANIFWEFLQSPSYKGAVFTGILGGFTFLTKHSGLIIVPFFILTWAFFVIAKKNKRKTLWWGGVLIVIASFITLHAGYGFRESGQIPEFFWSHRISVIKENPVGKILLTSLFPRAYLAGLDYQLFLNEFNDWRSYFAGSIYSKSLWYYLPFAFLVKTPIPLLILLLTSVIVVIKQHHSNTNYSYYLLALMFWFFIFFSFSGTRNIGLRYLLMIIPILCIFISSQINLVMSKGKVVIFSLLCWYAWASIQIAPFYLAYANEFIGGSRNAWKYFADSTLDWGQDNLFFDEYLASHPEIVAVNPKVPVIGKVAVNVNTLNLFHYQDLLWLRRLNKEPIDEIGYTWLIFNVTPKDLTRI